MADEILELNLTDDNFVDEIISSAYLERERILNERLDSDYKVNPVNMDDLVNVIQSVINLTKSNDIKIEPLKLVTKEKHAWISFSFPYLYINGMDYREFVKSLKDSDAIEVDATLDGVVHVSLMVRDVFRHK